MTEVLISIKIEPLEEGGYLATSDDLQGLIAQGRSVAETMEIAQDVARRLIESYIAHDDPLPAQIRKSMRPRRNRRATVKIPVVVDVED